MPGAEREAHHFPYLELILGTALIASLGAFSYGSRRRIVERDGVDVWDGSTESLEAAHINHDKQNPRYDDPSNGRLLTTRNHYIDHFNRAGKNGLTRAGNNYALRMIWERLSDSEREGLTPPPSA